MPEKYIQSPEIMWELFLAYVKDVKARPFLIKDWVGKDGDQVEREKERPLTIEGFENYVCDQGIINDLGDYFSNKNGKYADFSTICSRVRRSIREDQISGGMAGIFNPSITQRLNGLVEKSQTDGTTKLIVEYIDGNQSPDNTSETPSSPTTGL